MTRKVFLLAAAACFATAMCSDVFDVAVRKMQERKKLADGFRPRSSLDAPGQIYCVTEAGEEGECVMYYLCNLANNTIITDGKGVMTERAFPIPCKDYLKICCLPPARLDRPPQPPPGKVGCGWSNPSHGGAQEVEVSARIAGGSTAAFAEFPWMVAVLRYLNPGQEQPTVYLSSGSLIHPSIVLTAAHRVHKYSAQQLLAQAGEWDTSVTNEPYPKQNRKIREVVIHKDFNGGNLFNDIGLLFLLAPLDLAPNVGLACLPPPGALPRAGARCFVSGWGTDNFNQSSRWQTILKKVEVPVVGRELCEALMQRSRLGRHFRLDQSFVCAGEEGADACTGDGGSPLVCPSEHDASRYIQHGIVSWGIDCATTVPGAYAAVGYLRSWVDAQVRRRGFDTAVYSLRT